MRLSGRRGLCKVSDSTSIEGRTDLLHSQTRGNLGCITRVVVDAIEGAFVPEGIQRTLKGTAIFPLFMPWGISPLSHAWTDTNV